MALSARRRGLQVALVIGWIVAVHLVVDVFWLRADTFDVNRVPDGPAHALGLEHLLTGLDIGGVGAFFRYLREIQSYYPVVVHIPAALCGLTFGVSALVFRLANLFYLALLLVGVYKVGRECHGRRAGLLAAALVSLMPAVYGGARTVGLDFPELCLTPLAVYFLLRSQSFSRLRPAALFGVTAGLAALAKGQALLFLFFPAVVALATGVVAAVRDGAGRIKPHLVGSGVALGALLLTTAVWWWGRLGYLAQIMASHSTGEGMMFYEGDISFLGGVSYFLGSFPFLVSGPLALGVVCLAPPFFRASRHRWTILAWVVLPLLLHMVLKVRHYRYLFPLVPAVAVILAVGICSVRRRLQGPLAGAFAALSVALWIVCSFVEVDRLPSVLRGGAWPKGGVLGYALTCGERCYTGPPLDPRAVRTSAPARRIARWIERHKAPGERAILYFPHEHELVQLAVLIQGGVPDLRLTEDHHPAFLRYRPPRSWQRYVLNVAGGLPELRSSAARLVYTTDCLLQFAPQPVRWERLELWQLDPSMAWPPPRCNLREVDMSGS